MANCLIGYDNKILTGTLVAGSEQAGLTIGNLQSPQGNPAFGWRTVAGVRTSAAGSYFTLDSGSTTTAWRVFALARSNLSPSAQVRWKIGTTLSGADVYDSGLLSAGVVAGIGQTVHAAPSQVVGRYMRCEIENSVNTDTYIAVALAYAGPAFQPAINFSIDAGMGQRRGQQKVRTRAGGTYITPQYTERAWSVAFNALTAAELSASVIPADLAAADGRNVLFVPDPSASAALRNAESILGPMESAGDFGFATLDGARRTWRMNIVERL